jgi:hypothetical protein
MERRTEGDNTKLHDQTIALDRLKTDVIP